MLGSLSGRRGEGGATLPEVVSRQAEVDLWHLRTLLTLPPWWDNTVETVERHTPRHPLNRLLEPLPTLQTNLTIATVTHHQLGGILPVPASPPDSQTPPVLPAAGEARLSGQRLPPGAGR